MTFNFLKLTRSTNKFIITKCEKILTIYFRRNERSAKLYIPLKTGLGLTDKIESN